MKVLIGYDGSPSADAAVEELRRAALPVDTKILVLTAGEIWMPPPNIELYETALASRRVSTTMAQLESQAAQTMKQAGETAGEAAARIRREFPEWEVETEFVSGDAATAILEKAAAWNADLIIVGSQNRSAVGRLFLGSVSKKVVAEAVCSVRVARGGCGGGGESARERNAPRRAVAGLDDAAQSASAMLEALARRRWPKQSVLLLVTATDSFARDPVQPFGQIIGAQEFQKAARETLAASGLKILTAVREGEARAVLLEEAEKLSADCIFVGTREIRGALNRFWLGSVSDHIVTNAPCSVEVVRAA